MSTLSNALKGLLIAGSLLAANATPAGDVTSDRHQLSLQVRAGVADRTPVEGNAMKICSCASAKDTHGTSGLQR